MKFYIDRESKCHHTNMDGTFREFENPFFDGKSAEFITGYKFFPSGKTSTLPDGTVFDTGMITPWKPYAELDAAQREYEKALIAEYTEALKVVGVDV